MKQNKISTALLLFILAIAGCKKVKDNNVQNCSITNTGIITGTAYYTDYYTGNRSFLIGQEIYIKDAVNNDILQSVKTDSTGNFAYYGLDTCQLLTVYAYQFITSPFSIPYYGEVSSIKLSMNNSNIVLNETVWDTLHDGISYSGITLTTADLGAGSIANVSVYVYYSDTLALHDTTMNGTGSFTHFTTDSNGKRILIFPTQNPINNSLYINALISIDTATKDTLWIHDTLINLQNGFTPITLLLHKK